MIQGNPIPLMELFLLAGMPVITGRCLLLQDFDNEEDGVSWAFLRSGSPHQR
jgi:hypothetical protein